MGKMVGKGQDLSRALESQRQSSLHINGFEQELYGIITKELLGFV